MKSKEETRMELINLLENKKRELKPSERSPEKSISTDKSLEQFTKVVASATQQTLATKSEVVSLKASPSITNSPQKQKQDEKQDQKVIEQDEKQDQKVIEKDEKQNQKQDQSSREQSQQEQSQQEQSQQEQSQREQPQREQPQREQPQREQPQREQPQREQSQREQSQREQSLQEQQLKDHTPADKQEKSPDVHAQNKSKSKEHNRPEPGKKQDSLEKHKQSDNHHQQEKSHDMTQTISPPLIDDTTEIAEEAAETIHQNDAQTASYFAGYGIAAGYADDEIKGLGLIGVFGDTNRSIGTSLTNNYSTMNLFTILFLIIWFMRERH